MQSLEKTDPNREALHKLQIISKAPKLCQKLLYDDIFYNAGKKHKLWMMFVDNFYRATFVRLHVDIQEDMFRMFKDKPDNIVSVLNHLETDDRYRCFQMLESDQLLESLVRNTLHERSVNPACHFLNRMYLLCLLTLAKSHLNEENRLMFTQECNVLYRNKPKWYFDKILNGKKCMRVYPKVTVNGQGAQGDPYSPINHEKEGFRPRGLFFASSVGKDGTPCKTSPYGNTRLSIPIEELINVNEDSIYFADFYCRGGRYHYVTLLVTKLGSTKKVQKIPINKWCSNNLIRLSTTGQDLSELSTDLEPCSEQQNPFLFYDEYTERWMTCGGVWLHVFYTEDIDISPESLDKMGATISPTEIPEKPRNQWKPREDRFHYDVRGFGFDSPVYDHPGHGYAMYDHPEHGYAMYDHPGHGYAMYDHPGHGYAMYGHPGHGYGYPGYGRTGYYYPGYSCTGYGYSGYGSTGYGYPRYSSPGRGKSGYKMAD